MRVNCKYRIIRYIFYNIDLSFVQDSGPENDPANPFRRDDGEADDEQSDWHEATGAARRHSDGGRCYGSLSAIIWGGAKLKLAQS
jgi:hypothetical protein